MEKSLLRRRVIDKITRVGSWIVECGSGEYLLVETKRNGGGIVFLRALHSTFVVLSIALIFRNVLDPTRSLAFSSHELLTQLSAIGPWFGTVFAATYVGLYSRFASQWSYLAGVYNQIKAAECRKPEDGNCLAEWKAGFIEDAEDLHLIGKSVFGSIARAWLQDMLVCTAYEAHTLNGSARLTALRHWLGLPGPAKRPLSANERTAAESEREDVAPVRRAR
jgi:hypothetical protein